MGIKDKWNTEEYKNYNRAIVKLLGESLKDGEFFIFSKKGEYGMILSEERLKGLSLSQDSRMRKVLNALVEKQDGNSEWFTGVVDNYKLNVQ
jgi:hypothetical protein